MNTIRNTLVEVAYSVIPITAIIFIIQIALKLPYEELVRFVGGAILVFIGLVLFLLGTKIGIVPIGERIGEYLHQTGKLIVVLIFGTLLGFAVTVAEPNVQVLATQVDLASDGAIPKTVLVMSVGIGVAIFIALALIRLVKGKHINYFLLQAMLWFFCCLVHSRTLCTYRHRCRWSSYRSLGCSIYYGPGGRDSQCLQREKG